METPATDVEFDVVNLSGSAAVELDDLPDSALGRAMKRVRRDALDHRAVNAAMFESAL
ncbi:FxSxx-COOH cyclophane-containing RiPP peptide [Streptomyces sp. NPDC001617]